MASSVAIVRKDNGYFEVVRFGCGCERRLTTEYMQFGAGLEGRRQRQRERAAAAHRCDGPTTAEMD